MRFDGDLLAKLHNERESHWSNATKMETVTLLTFLSKSGIITCMLNGLCSLCRQKNGGRGLADHCFTIFVIADFACGVSAVNAKNNSNERFY